MGGEPGGEVVGALEIEQGFRKRLELLQGEGLDAGGGGLAQGAAAAGELAESEAGGFLMAALGEPVLGSTCVPEFFVGDAGITRCPPCSAPETVASAFC